MIVKNKVLGFFLFSLFFMSLSSVSQAQQKACRRVFTTDVKKNFPTYEEGQSSAQLEGIKTQEEHKANSKNLGQASTPNTSYVGRWNDIVKLFEETEETVTTELLSYEEAQSLVQSEGIKTWAEYKANYKRLELPSDPNKSYKESWQGMGHFLGTEFPSYKEAQGLVQSAGIKTAVEYNANYKSLELPSDPNQIYKESWQGWGHFLGSEGRTRTTEFPTYKEAQSLVQSEGIKTWVEYKANYQSMGLPSNPNKSYKESWQGLGHFFGTEFPSYEEAQSLVQSEGIKTWAEYKENYKRMELPSNPSIIYKEIWQGLGHFFGTEGRTRKKEFPTYEEAQSLVQSEGIKTAGEYKSNYKRLVLPSNPNQIYKESWQGMGHFLGTGRTRKKEFPTYEEAQSLIQSEGIKTQKEYHANYKRLRLPSAPDKIYKESWQGLGHFLGIGSTRKKEFPSYEDAQSLVRSKGIKTMKEYRANSKSMGLPSNPHQIYKEVWQGLRYFFGTEFPNYEKAKSLVQLKGIKTKIEYKASYKSMGLPSNPHQIYKESWQGWGHFLRTGRTRTKK